MEAKKAEDAARKAELDAKHADTVEKRN